MAAGPVDAVRVRGNRLVRWGERRLERHANGRLGRLVLGTFGSVAANAAAASIVGLLGFLIFGLGVGKILQDVYVRAWGTPVGSLKDQWRFALWFVAATTLAGLGATVAGGP